MGPGSALASGHSRTGQELEEHIPQSQEFFPGTPLAVSINLLTLKPMAIRASRRIAYKINFSTDITPLKVSIG